MAPTKAGSMGGKTPCPVVAGLWAACEPLRLQRVGPGAWKALTGAECAFSIDLQIDVEHISPQHLAELASAFEALAPAASSASPEVSPAAEQLWEWLSQPVGEGKAKSTPRFRAVIAVLAQALGGGGDLLPGASAAYLALLSAEGAERQWSSLFQTVIFRQLLRALRSLRRGDLRPTRGRKAAGGTGEELGDDAASQAGDMEDGEDEGGAADGLAVGSKESRELLRRLACFLAARGIAAVSAESVALAIEELATLVARPLDEEVAREAARGLAGLVAQAGGLEETRRASAAVIRATMPALMMTQDRTTAFQGAIPKPLQRARATVLNLVCGLVRNHSVALLSPQRAKEEVEAADVDGEQQEPSRKRTRRRAGGEESDEAPEEEPSATQQQQAAGTEGGADGEKRVRRKRPKSKAMDDPIVALLELLCVASPDRSEWRSYTADSIITVLSEVADVERRAALAAKSSAALTRRLAGKSKDPAAIVVDEAPELPIDEANAVLVPVDGQPPVSVETTGPAAGSASVERFMLFLTKLLESERVACRVLATEIALNSLERSGRLTDGGSGSARAELVRRLLVALVRRCSDAMPTVRGKALGGVAGALQSLAKCGSSTKDLLRALILDRKHPQYVDIPSLFRVSALDEKPTARKSALSLFDATLSILNAQLGFSAEAMESFFDIRLIAGLSADESILVRKASVSSLSQLLRLCPSAKVSELWRQNVLPLVLDVEMSVTERALDELEAAVINPLAEQQPSAARPGKAQKSQQGPAQLPWLPAVLFGIDSEATEYLQRGLKLIAKRNEGKLPKDYLATLARMVHACAQGAAPLPEWPVALWSMVEEVTAQGGSSSVADFAAALGAWVQFSKLSCGGTTAHPSGLGTKILKVLAQLVPSAPQALTDELMTSLCASLASFRAPPPLIRGMMAAIEKIEAAWKTKKAYSDRAKERAAWRASFLKSIQAMLAEAVRADSESTVVLAGSSQLEAALFSLGELALLDGGIVSEGIVTQVQTIATNTVYRDGQRVELGGVVRGQAFAALGKCCLKKEVLAKKSVELLVVHLNPNESFVVRNNVLIVLADLCAHYTSLVDRFVPCMTDLLRDSNELLRKHVAMIVASLLAEDYIKLRGSIFLRFLYVLSDPSDSVRHFAECVFARILHQRNVGMFGQQFLDVVCALNGWSGLAQYRGAEGNEDFSLAHSPSRRATIYRFMLSLMSSDQKFNVCAQLVTTLLAAFVDSEEATELPKTMIEPAGQALSDGLSLLCCKEMRICFSTQRTGQDEEDAEVGGSAANGGAASGEKGGAADAARAVLSSILKRNMCENIVPVLVQLKSLMEAKHSPFLRQLRLCLREILRDFKDDLQMMLSGDPHLAAEIAYDLQKEAGGEADPGVSAGACASVPAPLPPIPSAAMPHLGGASRRKSLGTMMRPPPVPIGNDDEAAADTADVDEQGSSKIPKARRSSVGTRSGAASAGRRAKAVVSGVTVAASGRHRSHSPAEDAFGGSSEMKADELNVAVVEDDGDEDWEPRGGACGGSKRRRKAQESFVAVAAGA